MFLQICLKLRYVILAEFTTAMTVQCDVYVDFERSYVEVVKSLSYCSRKLMFPPLKRNL